MSTPKKRLFELILTVVLIIVMVGLSQNSKVVESTDDLVLLEKRHPGYWEYLSPNRGVDCIIQPRNAKNLLVSDVKDKTIQGITITVNQDNSLTFNGTNTGDAFNIRLVDENIWLPDGTYFMSDGDIPTSLINMYVWSNDLGRAVAYGSNGQIEIDNFVSTYHCGLNIANGAAFNNTVIKPMISRYSEGNYSPFLRREQCTEALVFKVKSWDAISKDDLQIFRRNIKRLYKDNPLIIIQCSDGTEIEWNGGIESEMHLIFDEEI